MKKESSVAATVLITFNVFIALHADYMWTLPSELCCISLTMLPQSPSSRNKLALAFVAGTRSATSSSLIVNVKLRNRNRISLENLDECLLWKCILSPESIFGLWHTINWSFNDPFVLLIMLLQSQSADFSKCQTGRNWNRPFENFLLFKFGKSLDSLEGMRQESAVTYSKQ